MLSERINRAPASRLQIADLSLEEATHEVYRAGKRIELSPSSFRLLMYLMQNPHRVITREELEYAVWQESPPDSDAFISKSHGERCTTGRLIGRSCILYAVSGTR